jgi:hypothetical protein
MRRFVRVPLLLIGVVATLMLAGCAEKGVKKVTIKGTVSYKGQKLRSGLLRFLGPDGAPAGAVIQTDGTFIITDVVPGETKVGVSPTPQSIPPGEKEPPTPPISIPAKFQDPETSGVTVTITPDTTELDIELK